MVLRCVGAVASCRVMTQNIFSSIFFALGGSWARHVTYFMFVMLTRGWSLVTTHPHIPLEAYGGLAGLGLALQRRSEESEAY